MRGFYPTNGIYRVQHGFNLQPFGCRVVFGQLCSSRKQESRVLERKGDYRTGMSHLVQLPTKRLVEVCDAPTKRVGRTEYDDFQG
jgi:hypothetical protein